MMQLLYIIIYTCGAIISLSSQCDQSMLRTCGTILYIIYILIYYMTIVIYQANCDQ